jgi:hypothetical protein
VVLLDKKNRLIVLEQPHQTKETTETATSQQISVVFPQTSSQVLSMRKPPFNEIDFFFFLIESLNDSEKS